MMKRIGIMGGSFDPVHNGHLEMAEIAYKKLNLDVVWFMPTAKPGSYKKRKLDASNKERLEMVRLAISEYDEFVLSLEEYKRRGTIYTADTLQILTKKYSDTEWYFILGGDSLMQITTWKTPEIIFELSNIVAFTRADVDYPKALLLSENLKETYNAKVTVLDDKIPDVSSTQIREMIKNKEDIMGLLPKSVYEYIINNEIYGKL